MTPEQREILERHCRMHGSQNGPLKRAILAALDEIDAMNPPMPIEEYGPEQRRKLAKEIQETMMHPKK